MKGSCQINRRMRHAVLAVLIASPCATAWSQTAMDPRLVEFIPSPQHSAVLSDGRPAVTGYEIVVSVAGGPQVQRVSLGKPTLRADGMIREDFVSRLTSPLSPGVQYVSNILAIGPLGTATSVASNTFAISGGSTEPQTIEVSTEPQLQAALASLTSGSTVILAPGVYRLTKSPVIAGALTGVVIRGSTGRAADVVLEGAGMTNTAVLYGLSVKAGVTGLRIANLTIRNVAEHAIWFEGGVQSPRLSNLWLVDSGDSLVKATVNASGAGVDGGIVENSTLEYSAGGPSASAGGVDLRGAAQWVVRDSTFRNVNAPAGQWARPAVRANTGSRDTIVERNRFINCHVGVALGLVNLSTGSDHRGGVVVNNMFYRASGQAGGAAILIADSPGTAVIYNTVLQSGTSGSTIDVQFPESANLLVANNLVDGPIVPKDGASLNLHGNVTNATAGLFVNAATGDLHLQPSAAAAIDMATSNVTAPIDIDGEARPNGGAFDVGADEVDAANNVPTVALASPAAESTVRTGRWVTLEATAQDSDGSIAYVEFYVNSQFVSREPASPYSARWRPTEAGTYSIVAVAVDNAGGRATTPAVSVVASTR
jgi:Bacterial Ig domain